MSGAGVPVAYDMKFGGILQGLRELAGPSLLKAHHDIVKDVTHDYAHAVVHKAKDIVADGTNGSGRLAAGLGYYEPGYLHAHYRAKFADAQGNEAESHPSDAVWEERESRGVFHVDFGTTIGYAEAAMYGFVRPGDGRVIYIPQSGRFVRLNEPFEWKGLNAVEKAMDIVNSSDEGQQIYNKHFRRLQKAV